jgi:hypothetical protein
MTLADAIERVRAEVAEERQFRERMGLTDSFVGARFPRRERVLLALLDLAQTDHDWLCKARWPMPLDCNCGWQPAVDALTAVVEERT